MATGEHWHSEQKHIERRFNEITEEIEIKSYCLICGELIFNTKLKDK